jgi:post-segregation antitoxin (ccd killing protein)
MREPVWVRDDVVLAIYRRQLAEHGGSDLPRPVATWPSLPALFLLWYAASMNLTKRKVSVSLDEDLVEELEREDQGLSAQVNAAVRAELERRRRHRLLVEWLDQLDVEHGPVDESVVEKYVGLLR